MQRVHQPVIAARSAPDAETRSLWPSLSSQWQPMFQAPHLQLLPLSRQGSVGLGRWPQSEQPWLLEDSWMLLHGRPGVWHRLLSGSLELHGGVPGACIRRGAQRGSPFLLTALFPSHFRLFQHIFSFWAFVTAIKDIVGLYKGLFRHFHKGVVITCYSHMYVIVLFSKVVSVTPYSCCRLLLSFGNSISYLAIFSLSGILIFSLFSFLRNRLFRLSITRSHIFLALPVERVFPVQDIFVSIQMRTYSAVITTYC